VALDFYEEEVSRVVRSTWQRAGGRRRLQLQLPEVGSNKRSWVGRAVLGQMGHFGPE
jgi:hypothetical protein